MEWGRSIILWTSVLPSVQQSVEMSWLSGSPSDFRHAAHSDVSAIYFQAYWVKIRYLISFLCSKNWPKWTVKSLRRLSVFSLWLAISSLMSPLSDNPLWYHYGKPQLSSYSLTSSVVKNSIFKETIQSICLRKIPSFLSIFPVFNKLQQNYNS